MSAVSIKLFLLNSDNFWEIIGHQLQMQTLTMAGSCGSGCSVCGFGGSQTCRSLMSLPRKMIYSNISSRGATGLSVGRSSVPKDLTETQLETISGKKNLCLFV